MSTFDDRIVKVTIDIGSKKKTFTNLQMTATGTRYANALKNEAEIELYNLTKEDRDYILTETSPLNLNRKPKSVVIEAGRKSYGASVIYTGNVVQSKVSQPPDIKLHLKCQTGYFYNNSILSNYYLKNVDLYQIAKNTASNINTVLNFQAQNQLVKNFSFYGGAIHQVDALGKTGNISAYVDNNQLIVKENVKPLIGPTKIVSKETGMIGIPDLTEQGIKVKYFIDNFSKVGAAIQVKSFIDPAANGVYVIYKLGFDIASRDTNFYWIAEGKKIR